MDNATIIFTIVNALILIYTTWTAYRRSRFQNVVDDSQAAINFRKLVTELQAELKEARAETQTVKEMLDNAHLEVKLEIQMGEAPIIKNWEWKRRKIEEPR